jgi:hypothetical protein
VLTAGYLGGTRLDARLYNLALSTVLPAALAGLGWWQSRPLVLARIWQAAAPWLHATCSLPPNPPAPSQRHRSPDQKGLPLNATCPAARIRPEELT